MRSQTWMAHGLCGPKRSLSPALGATRSPLPQRNQRSGKPDERKYRAVDLAASEAPLAPSDRSGSRRNLQLALRLSRGLNHARFSTSRFSTFLVHTKAITLNRG